MARHIPFVYTATDAMLVRNHYADSELVRLCLETVTDVSQPSVPSAIWIDGGVDGFCHWPRMSPRWQAHISRFNGWDRIPDPQFQLQPDQKLVNRFVGDVLDACAELGSRVSWISVPQLPMVVGSERNKINRALAKAADEWATRSRFRGRFVLPVIFTHQDQINSKTARTQKLTLIKQCRDRANAKVLWIVDSSLNDQAGTGTFEKVRFPGVIEFHRELKGAVDGDVGIIAGPYWGLNLVLWSRGLADYVGVGVGVGYQYRSPGGVTQRQGLKRVALPPLRRVALVNPELQRWLHNLSGADPAIKTLRELERNFSRLELENVARTQVARFYKSWYDLLEGAALSGRSLALYQDLSAAYVFGKSLPPLSDAEGTARRPERVAQQLMLQCL